MLLKGISLYYVGNFLLCDARYLCHCQISVLLELRVKFTRPAINFIGTIL
jgi:hypothetical protein